MITRMTFSLRILILLCSFFPVEMVQIVKEEGRVYCSLSRTGRRQVGKEQQTDIEQSSGSSDG